LITWLGGGRKKGRTSDLTISKKTTTQEKSATPTKITPAEEASIFASLRPTVSRTPPDKKIHLRKNDRRSEKKFLAKKEKSNWGESLHRQGVSYRM